MSRSPRSSGASSGARPSKEITRILAAVEEGDARAADALLPLVYAELRKLAARRMARERAGQTLQPTALVHEAYLRLVGDREARWENRAHFFAAAAEAMRRILIERARRRRAVRHGGDWTRTSLDETAATSQGRPADLLALDTALRRLEARDERLGRMVTLRYFAGLSVEETAEILRVSPATVKRDWQYAKAWLYREINGDPSAGPG